MKLRNKKTGDVAVLNSDHNDSLADFGGKILVEANGKDFSYDTLAKFNEDWEDYEPVVPLIKDEKIRKAVRAWAEASKFEHLIYWFKSDEDYVSFMDGESELEIMFDSPDGFKGLKDDRIYTITELCGEEEE